MQFTSINPLLNNPEDDVTRYFRSAAKSSFDKNYVIIFGFFFEIYEPTNSKLAKKVDLYKIYAQSGFDVTSHFRSASSQYRYIQCKQTEATTASTATMTEYAAYPINAFANFVGLGR